MRSEVSCALCFALLACACTEEHVSRAGRTSESRARIIDGLPDPTESGTVAIAHRDSPLLCSGTVIARTLVVTAKHCVITQQSGADQALAGERFVVIFGPNVSSPVGRGTVASEWIGAPGNTEVQPAADAGEDVALLWLSSPAPADTKIHAVAFDYKPGRGDAIAIVGYGLSVAGSATDYGIKLTTTDNLNGFDPLSGMIQTSGRGACSGDSGGSFYFGPERRLVAITSTVAGSSQSSFCDLGLTQASSLLNVRVAKLLSDALAKLDVCSPIDEICSNGRDDDCDAVVDEQCTKTGQPCSADIDCESGMCRDAETGKICVAPCAEETACSTEERCVSDCDGDYCLAGNKGQKKLGAACSDSKDCFSDHCSSVGCTLVCRPSLGQCPDDMACFAAAGQCGQCTTLADVSGQRSLGESCQESSDCAEGGTCVNDGLGVLRCASPCFQGAVCPAGFLCSEGLCLRGGELPEGERCVRGADCKSRLCAAYTELPRNFCTKTCTEALDCAAGFQCKPELGSSICVPTARRLGQTCKTSAECTSGTCDPELGICTRECMPTSTPCPAGFRCRVSRGDLLCLATDSVAPAAALDSEAAGCGCRAAGQERVPPAWWFIIAASAAFVMRARRFSAT